MIYIDEYNDEYLHYKSSNNCGYNQFVFLDDSETILTSSPSVSTLYPNNTVLFLSDYLNFKKGTSLYTIFSYYFDGKISEDLEMIKAIMNGVVNDSSYCFCVRVGVTFCWFSFADDEIVIHGNLQFSDIPTRYHIGKFIKKLQFSIANSGFNLTRIKYLIWENDDFTFYFKDYIKDFVILKDFFNNVKGLEGVSLNRLIYLLNRKRNIRLTTAYNLVSCLKDNVSALGLREVQGDLKCYDIYYKDYSSCICRQDVVGTYSYGVILDCEGKRHKDGSLTHGCRNIGGIIYKYKDNELFVVDSFYCDEVLLEDTLLATIDRFKHYDSSKKTIDVYTFGNSDKTMLLASIESCCTKKHISLFRESFKFTNCSYFILDYLDKNEILMNGKRNLSGIAKSLGVLTVHPKHNPLSDARTLFNILSCIIENK